MSVDHDRTSAAEGLPACGLLENKEVDCAVISALGPLPWSVVDDEEGKEQRDGNDEISKERRGDTDEGSGASPGHAGTSRIGVNVIHIVLG